VWTSTKHGNNRLDQAFTESSQKGPIYLFFSVNGSGCFCGMAEMVSNLDYDKTFAAWSQDDKWSGQFSVKWIYIKNIPNKRLRNIRLVNNNNKSVTNSRDTQEVYLEPGKQVLKVFHTFEHSFSILDDFEHFDRLEDAKKKEAESPSGSNHVTSESLNGPSTSNVEAKSHGKETSGAPSRPAVRNTSFAKSFSEVSKNSEAKGKDSGRTYVPTSRGKGRGGTFAVKFKPNTTQPQ